MGKRDGAKLILTISSGLYRFVAAFLGTVCLTAPSSAAPFSWDGARGQYVTCLTSDTRGDVWVGTEDKGVWRFSPDGKWTQFGAQTGLGDDTCYSLACDRQGRVWAGTLNHGVSVFSGQAWKTYGILEGPLGVHVIALAVSPLSGDVWGATEAGVFCYSQSAKTWTSFGRAQGLPSDQANALAFNERGDLFVGTQIDGIAIGEAKTDYRNWRVVGGTDKIPNTPAGAGIPTSLINCLLVARSGVVFAGTTTGLASSRDNGATWSYVRGEDWETKVRARFHGPSPIKTPVAGSLLLEDYVTCLAEDGQGNLLVGHRQAGMESVSETSGARMQPVRGEKPSGDYVTALLPQKDGSVLLGTYNGGVARKVVAGVTAADLDAPAAAGDLPSAATPPSLAQINAMLRTVSAVGVDAHEFSPKVMTLSDDWQTHGDWLGRYGRYWACTCATQGGGGNYYWGAGWEAVYSHFSIGPNYDHALHLTPQITGDKLRYYVSWTYTDNPRSLELPAPYADNRVRAHSTTWDRARRQSEVDDHGETYPNTFDGPHIYTTLHVPHGLFTLSLYDFNKDAHEADNAIRDYRISVWVRDPTVPVVALDPFPTRDADVHTRLSGFRGGVYKRFLVRGPVNLTVKLDKNGSKNTILAGVMLDEVYETPAPYFATPEDELLQTITQRKAAKEKMARRASNGITPGASDAEAVNRLFDSLEDLRLVNSAWWSSHGQPYYAALCRWYIAQETLSTKNERLLRRIATCLYQTNQFSQWETYQNKAGLTTARQVEQALRWKEGVRRMYGYETVLDYLAAHKTTSIPNRDKFSSH